MEIEISIQELSRPGEFLFISLLDNVGAAQAITFEREIRITFATRLDVTMTWTEADALATSLGGYLVSILSQEENDFLQSTFFPTGDEAPAKARHSINKRFDEHR